MAVKSSYSEIEPYITKDGSLIRELMHPSRHGNRNQSLAEAIVEPGVVTVLHKHPKAEEIYHVVCGRGQMVLADELIEVRTGDTVLIPPGTRHQVRNTGEGPLRIFCCCSPPYSHDDTEAV